MYINREKKIKKLNANSSIALFSIMILFVLSLLMDNYKYFMFATISFSIATIIGLLNIFFNKSLRLVGRLLFLFFVFPTAWSSYDHILDSPIYLSKEYSVLEGYALIEQGVGKGAGRGITIRGTQLGYNVPYTIKVSDSGKYFRISYLPHTKIIVDWEIVKP
jgi:membrane-associated HD superfamily phosphohydrolase